MLYFLERISIYTDTVFRVLIQYAQRGFPRLPAGSGSPRTAADLFDAYMRVGKVESFKRDLDPFYTMFHLSSNVDAAPITDNIQYALVRTRAVCLSSRVYHFIIPLV